MGNELNGLNDVYREIADEIGIENAIAMFIITYCAIPIIVVFLVIWFIKFLFGITIPVPSVESLKVHKQYKKNNVSKELIEG